MKIIRFLEVLFYFLVKYGKKNDILREYYGELSGYRNGEYIVVIDIDRFRAKCIDSKDSECLMKYINHYENIEKT